MAGNSPAIGIDLGTTNSCVAVWQNGKVEIIANDEGSRLTPSMVAFTSTYRHIGSSAKLVAAENPTNTVYGVKRIIGRRFKDIKPQLDIQGWPFTVTHAGNKPTISVMHRGSPQKYTPEQISAMILTRMKETAEAYLEQEIKNAVITVPASFNDSQKKATIDAGKIAGLNVLRLISEPTAAAIAYGMDRKIEGKRYVLVFDFGGGTFDVSILVLKKGKVKVKAAAGDTNLGGGDIDNRLLLHCVKDFIQKHKQDITSNKRAMFRLKNACEDAKINLSTRVTTTIEVDSLHNGIDYYMSITRSRFEEINVDLFSKTLRTVQRAMEDAKMSKNDIDDVVLVGGSTRIPKIQTLLQEYFNGKPLKKGINPDEAVAYGAAIQAAKLQGDIKDLRLVDVSPLSLGIQLGNEMCVIIPRNTAIPTKKTKNVTTSSNYQESIRIDIFEGESRFCKYNNLLGIFVLGGLPRAPKGHVNVEITFEIDSDGILSVYATEETSKTFKSIKFTYDQGRLSGKDVTLMMQEAEISNAEDKRQRMLAFYKTELEEYITGIKEAIKSKSRNKILGIRKDKIMDQCNKITELLLSNQVNSVEECELLKKNLKELWEPIAGNRH